jgi:hypothetical protein
VQAEDTNATSSLVPVHKSTTALVRRLRIKHLAALRTRCAESRFVCVGDRERDVHELFATEHPDGVDWLNRAAHDRCVHHPAQYLWKSLRAKAPLGHTALLVPAGGSMPQRTARLTLRCAAVRLWPPKTRASRLGELDAFAIMLSKKRPPHGTEPLEWMLLSSVPTTSLDDALERLDWYARRWTIESWHRVLKSGCRIQARQSGNLERCVRATALFAVISRRILYATLLARIDSDLSCEVLLQPVEWKALYCHWHHTRYLRKKRHLCSKRCCGSPCSGGYLNRKHDRPPGPTVIWRGFLILHEITKMYQLFRQNG